MWATPLRCPHIHRLARAARTIGALRHVSSAQWRGDNLPDRQARHGADLNRQVRIDAVPHIVPSTHAGAVFHSLRTSSMRGQARAGGSAGPAVRVCRLPGSGAHLQVLRPRPDLLCQRLCAGGPTSRPARRRPALPDEPPRSPGPCGAGPSLARPAKERDASGFPAAAPG
jgi:hypothetical protein